MNNLYSQSCDDSGVDYSWMAETYAPADQETEIPVARPLNSGSNQEPKKKKAGKAEQPLKEQAQAAVESLKSTLGDLNSRFEDLEVDDDPSEEETRKGIGVLNTLNDFLRSKEFEDGVYEYSRFSGMPPKKVANNFAGRIVGTIGDILGLAIDVIHHTVDFAVELLAKVIMGGASLICKVANAITSVATLNLTAAGA